MSYNNSDKEFYYALYLKFYKEKLEEVLKIKLGEIELEKNINERKVDIYTVAEEDNRELFMELQLTNSDNLHLEQIMRIIEIKELTNIIIVWMAADFKNHMLDAIREKISEVSKNIYFVALKLNENIFGHLDILNNTFVTQVVENLKILNKIENQFKVMEIYYRIQDENNTECFKKKEETLDLSRKEHVMKRLLNELRREIFYYPSIYRDKKIDNVIVLAGGKSGINYFIGLNRKNYLFVELRFSEHTEEIFQKLIENEAEINDKLDFLAEFDTENLKIGTYLYFSNNKKEIIIKRIARVIDKYIRVFTPYTFPNKAEE